MELLEKMSQVAAGAHAPFLSAAGADLMNLESFTQLDAPRDLAKIFDTTEYAKWKSFRQSEDSRYVGLCVPHILMRLPYGKDTKPVDGFELLVGYMEIIDISAIFREAGIQEKVIFYGIEDISTTNPIWRVFSVLKKLTPNFVQFNKLPAAKLQGVVTRVEM